MNKLKNIINSELKGLVNELHDPNFGNLYQPPGLDPSVVRLFEETDDFYRSTLDDKYWTEIGDKFPNYNNPDSEDCDKAVDFIIKNMKDKYPDKNWDKIEQPMRKKVRAGMT